MLLIPKKDRVLVEGVNIVKKHTKPIQVNPQGGIISQEAPIHVSNVMLIDPKTGEPTRVGYKDWMMVKKFVLRKNPVKFSINK